MFKIGDRVILPLEKRRSHDNDLATGRPATVNGLGDTSIRLYIDDYPESRAYNAGMGFSVYANEAELLPVFEPPDLSVYDWLKGKNETNHKRPTPNT